MNFKSAAEEFFKLGKRAAPKMSVPQIDSKEKEANGRGDATLGANPLGRAYPSGSHHKTFNKFTQKDY